MEINLAKRHWFDNELGLLALEENVLKMEPAAELGRDYGFDLSFLVSADGSAISTEMNERALYALSRLEKFGWAVKYDLCNQSAAAKFISQLFPDKPEGDVLALCCMDQYPLYEAAHFEAASDLALKLIRDKKTYANGSRNVPAVLGANKDASNMRIIHELVNGFAAGYKNFRTETPEWASPHKAYEKFGESTSGFFFINPKGKNHKFLRHQIKNNLKFINWPEFTLEYLTAISAGLADTVSTGYVYAEKNAFYEEISPTDEKKKRENFIYEECLALGQTDAGPALDRALSNKRNFDKLCEFFSPDLVNYVSDIMKRAILDTN